ncbi:MAG: hypothetical protein RLZZ399_2734, partial [Verrucomicrobiota bacterium]
MCAPPDAAEASCFPQSPCGGEGDHVQQVIRGEFRVLFMNPAQLGQEAQGVCAGEAVCADADIHACPSEPDHGEGAVTEVGVASRTVNHVGELTRGESAQKIKIGGLQLVEVGKNPVGSNGPIAPKPSEGGIQSTVVHGPVETGEKGVEGPGAMLKHCGLLWRFTDVCRQEHSMSFRTCPGQSIEKEGGGVGGVGVEPKAGQGVLAFPEKFESPLHDRFRGFPVADVD